MAAEMLIGRVCGEDEEFAIGWRDVARGVNVTGKAGMEEPLDAEVAPEPPARLAGISPLNMD